MTQNQEQEVLAKEHSDQLNLLKIQHLAEMANLDNELQKELFGKVDQIIIQQLNDKHCHAKESMLKAHELAINDVQLSGEAVYQDMLKRHKYNVDQLLDVQHRQRNDLFNQHQTIPADQPMFVEPLPQTQKRRRGKRGGYLKRRSEALEKTLVNIYAYRRSGRGFSKRGRGAY